MVAIADADSYVKWAGAMLDTLPDVDRRMLIVRTPLTVSEDQQAIALDGTGLGQAGLGRAGLGGTGVDGSGLGETGLDGTEGAAGSTDAVLRVAHGELAARLAQLRADVVVIAGRGPFVRLVQREVDRLAQRPVVVTGLPGISIPAQRGAVQYRRHSDLVVVHSLREVRAFREVSRRIGADLDLGLATLPFARASSACGIRHRSRVRRPGHRAARAGAAPRDRRHAARRGEGRSVPAGGAQAAPRPEQGETETHYERLRLADLLADRPDNLVLSYEPMHRVLDRAEGLVTVSSTAAIEAMARGVPVIALAAFGVRKTLLNTVFRGSGLLGDADDVIARRFRHPHPLWMRDNYFHDPADSTWWDRVRELVELRRRGLLPARPVPEPRGGALHAAFERKAVLGHEDRTLSGAVAIAIGTPLAGSLIRLRRARQRGRALSWTDDATDITVTPALYQDPIRRPVPV
ncbi:DUF6716 putative glycosyltransferase [Microbacterium elymi]|uniref:Uncharacterized protein n=1 Tax=Microbacterium elymi TaxID=2909587 RepID=A0ABY5NMA1_9MICO|nr:DUF6716 putative glycosyltransferase [Microbacterium elymi]UUT36312.1 hypothetical protein L2X98_25500 [Microbacterium elymi]